MTIDIIILAGGKGSRMCSEKPKVLHTLAGKSLLKHVLATAECLIEKMPGGNIHIVAGYKAEEIKSTIKTKAPIKWYLQEQQLGTGHAVQQALSGLNSENTALILYGDVPLIHSDTLTTLLQHCNDQQVAILTAHLSDPTGYGRIIRDKNNDIISIVEQKDTTTWQRQCNEINTGIMAVPGNKLQPWIRNLKNNNSQKEFYLTDIITMAKKDNIPVTAIHPHENYEIQGINTLSELVCLERLYQSKQAHYLLTAGVLIQDPTRFDLRGTIHAGKDVTIDINTVFEGNISLGNNVIVEPGCIIKNSKIGDDTIIKSYSIIEDSVILAHCTIGPFARLRPKTYINNYTKVGNFVEIKKTTIGENSKINHLTYIGDTQIGNQVNIGAGTVTCNYDGSNKHKTLIGDNAFIGTNNTLIAPVAIGKEATTGAGSTITDDVPENHLAIARARQNIITHWQRPKKLN